MARIRRKVKEKAKAQPKRKGMSPAQFEKFRDWALHQKNISLRVAALQALGKTRRLGSLKPVLEQAMKSKEPMVRKTAREIYRKKFPGKK